MKKTFGKRGFATIATGSSRYYKIALNLLRSYRQFAKEPLPFAILTDQKNQWRDEFDDVVVLSDASNNYNDKLKLFRELPYDETIFIDADCLAFGDLNEWWNIFAEAGDFSCFGRATRDLNRADFGWFDPRGMKEFADKIEFIPSFNGGVYYLRNAEKCAQTFEIANRCAERYQEYRFNVFSSPADEPLLALGMAVCGCEPVNLEEELVFRPSLRRLTVDVSVPSALYRFSDAKIAKIRLIHFGNFRTRLGFYRNVVAEIDDLRTNRRRSKAFRALRLAFYWCCNVAPYAVREYRCALKWLRK